MSSSPRAKLWIIVVIAGAQLMVVLDTTIMLIALPTAQHSLGFSNVDRQWVITGYTLTFGGLLLLGGRISDMVGPKRTLAVGVAGFAVASAFGGAAQNFTMLVTARSLQGVFGALLAPSVLSLLSTTFSAPAERARAFGIYASIAISGAAFGLILGGLLTQYLGWRWCLYVNVPIAVAVSVGVSTVVPSRERRAGPRLDVPGAVLGCGGLAALVYGFGEAAADGWHSVSVIVALTLAVVLLASFVILQTQTASPLLPLRVLSDRTRAGAYTTILLAILANFGAFLFLTYLMQTVDGFSPLKTGFAFLPLMVVNGLAATQIASRLLTRVPTRFLVMPGLFIAAIGSVLLTGLTAHSSYATHILPAELCFGLGFGLAMVPCMSSATSNADPKDAGVTAAMANTSQQIGASIGTALMNTIAASATASFLAAHAGSADLASRATVHGYVVASVFATGVLLLAVVVGGTLINANPRRDRARLIELAEATPVA